MVEVVLEIYESESYNSDEFCEYATEFLSIYGYSLERIFPEAKTLATQLMELKIVIKKLYQNLKIK